MFSWKHISLLVWTQVGTESFSYILFFWSLNVMFCPWRHGLSGLYVVSKTWWGMSLRHSRSRWSPGLRLRCIWYACTGRLVAGSSPGRTHAPDQGLPCFSPGCGPVYAFASAWFRVSRYCSLEWLGAGMLHGGMHILGRILRHCSWWVACMVPLCCEAPGVFHRFACATCILRGHGWWCSLPFIGPLGGIKVVFVDVSGTMHCSGARRRGPCWTVELLISPIYLWFASSRISSIMHTILVMILGFGGLAGRLV